MIKRELPDLETLDQLRETKLLSEWAAEYGVSANKMYVHWRKLVRLNKEKTKEASKKEQEQGDDFYHYYHSFCQNQGVVSVDYKPIIKKEKEKIHDAKLPSDEVLLVLYETKNLVEIGKRYGVPYEAVRERIKKLGVYIRRGQKMN